MTGIGWVADIGLWRFLCFRKADVGKRTFVRGPDPLVVRAGHCERQILIGSAHHYVRVGITLTVVLPETDGANLIGSPFTNGAIAAARARVKRRDGRVHGVSIRWRLMSASGAVANRPLFLPQTDWRLLGIFLGSRAHERRERVVLRRSAYAHRHIESRPYRMQRSAATSRPNIGRSCQNA